MRVKSFIKKHNVTMREHETQVFKDFPAKLVLLWCSPAAFVKEIGRVQGGGGGGNNLPSDTQFPSVCRCIGKKLPLFAVRI